MFSGFIHGVLESFSPWYGSIIFHCMDVPPLVYRHYSFFSLWLLLNDAAMKVHVQFLCKHTFSIILVIFLEVELPDHMVMFNFSRTAILFSKVMH